MIDDIRAVGNLQPNEFVVIAPEIAGRIASIAFGEGAKVKEGAVLVELDPVILKADLDKARSDVTLASANRERAETLAERGSGTNRARDEANAAYRAAQVNLALAEARLSKSTLIAPFSGVMGLRAVSPGAYVAPGQRIVELVQVDPLKVDFRVPENNAPKVRVGQTVLIASDASPDGVYEGKIYAIDPLIDVNGRAIRLRANVPNADGKLSPGFFARLRVVTERRPNAILVPESAIFPLGGRTLVYKVVDGKAVQQDVTLGQRMPGQVEVREGLKPGDVDRHVGPAAPAQRHGSEDRRRRRRGRDRMFEFFIRRPVFSTVLSLLILLIGLVSYGSLTIREYPNIDQPVVNVRTSYPGASAEIIESQVTQVLEASIAGISGIEVISSSSRPEESQIQVRFRLGTDPDTAASDVRDRVGRVRKQLPAETEEPVIAKVEADAQAVVNVALLSDRHTALELSDYASRFIKNQLQNLPGVSEVRIFGERRYAMRIWIDRLKLVSQNLTVQDVETALRQQNVEVPSGRIEGPDREFTVLARTGLTSPEQFRRIVVKDVDGFPIFLGDLARIELGPADERRTSTFMGDTAIILGVVKQATANPLDVSLALRKVLPNIRRDLPSGMNIDVSYDRSVFIEESIKNVYKTIAEAALLVVIVIFIFLRTLRATIIPLVTIPLSLIGSFAIMSALGFSINSLTLLAMVLAIGLVVDDAIVVLENIHRHIEEGLEPVRAAIVGIRRTVGRSHRHDADARGRLRAGRVLAGANRQAVRRVRAHPRRRRHGLGFHRADAEPDDVLEDAQGARTTRAPLQPHRERPQRPQPRVPEASLRDFESAAAHHAAGARRHRQRLLPVHQPEGRTRADRGSRRTVHHRPCARGLHHRLHQSLFEADGETA